MVIIVDSLTIDVSPRGCVEGDQLVAMVGFTLFLYLLL